MVDYRWNSSGCDSFDYSSKDNFEQERKNNKFIEEMMVCLNIRNANQLYSWTGEKDNWRYFRKIYVYENKSGINEMRDERWNVYIIKARQV